MGVFDGIGQAMALLADGDLFRRCWLLAWYWC